MNEGSKDFIINLNKELQIYVDEYNNTGIDSFEGLSPTIMYNLLYNNWGNNIISINPSKFDGNDIPIIMQIKYFIKTINQLNEIKLTKTGNLPPSIVKDIYNNKFISDRMIEMGITKLTKETNVDNITFMKNICIISGIIKKRKNTITLTKNIQKEMETTQFIEKILQTIFYKFNWAYFDLYDNEEIGKLGNNYTLYLLNKYGDNWKKMDFYAKLYFKAFPELLKNRKIDFPEECFIYRTFNQIFKYCGFIDFENGELDAGRIKVTETFKKYVKIGMYVA
jgi:hypothetical protein